jgi:hypothetical protein
MPPTKAPSKALTVAKELSPDELTELLQQSGWAEKSSGEAPLRMKLDGAMLTTPDGGMYVYNPTKPNVPALTVRIVKPPEEYWAIWVDAAAAASIDRMDLKDTFSKKFVNPDPSRRVWDSDEAFESLRDAGNKASWKADILLQIVPDSGVLTGDEPIYTLTMSTTSLIEFKGASRSPLEGSVSDQNFITKLSNMAATAEGVTDPRKAVMDALTSLTLGGVVAEVRILRAENKELNRIWSVVSFDPIHIEPMTEADNLLKSGDPDEVGI